MTWSHLHREEAQNVGDPEDEPIQELLGIAPPCNDCSEEAVGEHRGVNYCDDCMPNNE